VPQAKLACDKVGDDGDGMAVQPGRPALRLLSGPAACMGRQLVRFHGVENRSSTRRGGGVRAPGSRRVSWPTPQSESGRARAGQRLVVRGGDLSREVPLVGNWSEMLPTHQEHDVLPVRVLTRVLSPPRLESWPSRCQSWPSHCQ
jgi:hypothetical protein